VVVLVTVFAPPYRPDTRLPGWGLGFCRDGTGGRRVVGREEVLPGFNSPLFVVSDDGGGVAFWAAGGPAAARARPRPDQPPGACSRRGPGKGRMPDAPGDDGVSARPDAS
jgi:hypothetical protein